MNFWDQIRDDLQHKVSAESYDNWLKDTAFAALDGDTLLVSVPDRETQDWLETEYSSLVTRSMTELRLPIRKVAYEAQPVRGTRNQALAAVESSPEIDNGASSLNPKFTFESFVVGNCNQFAHAAAEAVAKNPSRSYNPLF